MFTRLKEAWQVLRGRWWVKQKNIYVYASDPENKFVQLVPWRDNILALDAQGKIWLLGVEYDGFPTANLWIISPIGEV